MDRTPQVPFLVGDVITERYYGTTTTGPVVKIDNTKVVAKLSVKTERNGKPFFVLCDPTRANMVMPVGGWPVRYRDYEISLSMESLAPRYEYLHKDFDGPEHDNRCGHAETIVEALESIDERIDS